LCLFRRLAAVLPPAARFQSACRSEERKSAYLFPEWGVPPLFFFHRPHQTEWETVRTRPVQADAQLISRIAAHFPDEAAAWAVLPDLLDDAMALLCGSALIRHAARAIPGFLDKVNGFADDLPKCRELADVLAIPDDEMIRVYYPERGLEARVLVQGVATVSQFHVLLADALNGTYLPGRRPSLDVVEASRFGVPCGAEPPVARAVFQLMRPAALRDDGTLPASFAASDHWHWGREPLTALTRVDGERTVLLAPPAYPAEWEVTSRFPAVRPDLKVVEVKQAVAPLASAA
jgi:hypothetical protein